VTFFWHGLYTWLEIQVLICFVSGIAKTTLWALVIGIAPLERSERLTFPASSSGSLESIAISVSLFAPALYACG